MHCYFQAGLTCYHLAAAAGSPAFASFLMHRGAYTNRFNGLEQKKLEQILQKATQSQNANELQTARSPAVLDEPQSSTRLDVLNVTESCDTPPAKTHLTADEESQPVERSDNIAHKDSDSSFESSFDIGKTIHSRKPLDESAILITA